MQSDLETPGRNGDSLWLCSPSQGCISSREGAFWWVPPKPHEQQLLHHGQEFFPIISRLDGDLIPLAQPLAPRGSRVFASAPVSSELAGHRLFVDIPAPIPGLWVLLMDHSQILAAQEFCCNFLAQVVIIMNILAARKPSTVSSNDALIQVN